MKTWDLTAWADGQTLNFKWNAGRLKKPVSITKKGDRLWLKFPFSKVIQAEIKSSFTGYKWHGYEAIPKKQWSVLDCQHNHFQILYLAGHKPYEPYDRDLMTWSREGEPILFNGQELFRYRIGDHLTRHLMEHQAETVSHILTRQYAVLAEEMGSGKTLAAIEAMEASGKTNWLWVAPRSALNAVELEFIKWQSPIMPTFCTYASLLKHNNEWLPTNAVYDGIVFDESSRLKNPVAKRTIAAAYLADAVRVEHGGEGYVIEMSGSPAPKSPLDWYSQCEIAMPGFLKEGHINKLKDRLAVIHQRESAAGGAYPHLVTWLDDENKCRICGEFEDSDYHDIIQMPEWDDEDSPFHQYDPAKINEVENLHKRTRGLVIVKFKKDCMDLPDKIYRRIHCKPRRQTLNAAKFIQANSTSAVKALTALRQLSDGFQYSKEETGKEQCEICQGTKTVKAPVWTGPEKTKEFVQELLHLADVDFEPDQIPIDPAQHPDYYEWQDVACGACKGRGEVPTFERTTDTVRCPKVQVLKDILDEHNDVGRLVIFGGYTGSIDICTDIVAGTEGWDYIRVDGRGWHTSLPGMTSLEMLQYFQSGKDKVAFIGQPGAAGMGLTLTASPTIVYYSNDFNFESRIQSEDRIHRPGMDVNRGATIVDIIHLASDEYILNNLQKKKDLQKLTMGDITDGIRVE